MRALLSCLALAAVAWALPAEAVAPDIAGRLYRLDAAHSSVEFSVRYLKLMEVEGRFREWDAAVLGAERPETGAVAVVFKTASLDTGNETRDKHLKSLDFFDAEAHPLITFVSRRVARRGEGYVAHGTLAMHGVERPIEVPFRPAYDPMTDARGNARAGFVGEVTIDRQEFGVVGGNAFNAGFDPRLSIIDDVVRIRFAIHGMVAPIRAAPVDSLVSAVEADGVKAVIESYHRNPPPGGEDEEAAKARARAAGIFNAAGFRLMEAGRPDDAVELLRIAVLALPGNARALAGLAEGYARAGRDAPALENANRALAIDPAEVRALVVRASLGGTP